MNEDCIIAYFSMEVGIDPSMPTYSGGLGVLAGDTIRSSADLKIPMVAVTLLHRKGYFRQRLDDRGRQREEPVEWAVEDFLEEMLPRTTVTIEGRTVHLRAWRYKVNGIGGFKVPVYFLDTDLPENSQRDRTLTHFLYGGDELYRLCQEVVLGFGGVAILRALGQENAQIYHMNEGHSALLTLALLKERTAQCGLHTITEEDIEAVRHHCVFTTHTPVPAGHDQFSMELARKVLGEEWAQAIRAADCCLDGALNMTHLALTFSRYVNGVSMRHQRVSRGMFPSYPINSITNGVHAVTWASGPFCRLYDQHIPEWRTDNHYLRYAVSIPLDEILKAHGEAKQELLREVEKRTGMKLPAAVMTLGFARRATAYKRTDLLFSDIDRLKRIARRIGSLQIIYAGKAHSRDESGQVLIRRIFEAKVALGDTIQVIYLEDYDMALAKLLCSGVDLWLNTPQKPQEASGTSGMKAAINGVPSLSILDGWWVEGHVEGVTGWSIGDTYEPESNPLEEISSLYSKLEYVIVPMFYDSPQEFAKVMRSAIALNASFFNAQRMVIQYVKNTYSPLYETRGKKEDRDGVLPDDLS